MTVKRWFCIGSAVMLLATVGLIIYAKLNFHHVDYNDYIKKSTYNFINSVKSENNSTGMNYENDLGLSNFFIDEEINSLEDLKRLSDYILIVANNEQPTFKGNAIINNCTILKIIKGPELKENDKIKIYDLLFHWDIIRTKYLGGNTPLQVEDKYIVFLKRTEISSIPNTFVFNSVKYGRVSLLKGRDILENYEYDLPIEEILNYDFVFPDNSNKEILEYKSMVKQIRAYSNDEIN